MEGNSAELESKCCILFASAPMLHNRRLHPIDWGTVILSIDYWEEMKQTDSR